MDSKHKIKFINFSKDTVFFTTSYNYGWGGLTVTVFNSCCSISACRSAAFRKDSLQIFPNEFPYSENLKKDIFDWDTCFIRKMSQSKDFGSTPSIDISRIVIINNRFYIQTIRDIYEYR